MFTEDEEKIIKSLERLAKKWHASLTLFSWNGGLCVLKHHPNDRERGIGRVVASITGIPNDGGDPNLKEWDDE
jgi:hypothetical protein